MGSFKWPVLCASVGGSGGRELGGAGIGPVQAVPVCDNRGGTQTQRGRRRGRGQTWTTNIGLVSNKFKNLNPESGKWKMNSIHKLRILLTASKVRSYY